MISNNTYKELMILVILEENWKDIQKKVILPLWNRKFKKMYESVKLDYDDFESLAGFELTKAIKTFNPQKSNLLTYATNILQRKAKTELTFYHRIRRDGNSKTESINRITDEESKITIENMLVSEQEHELNYLAQRYINSLTKTQRKIAELIIEGYDVNIIKKMLGFSDDKFKMIIQRMRSEEKTEPLNKLRGVIK